MSDVIIQNKGVYDHHFVLYDPKSRHDDTGLYGRKILDDKGEPVTYTFFGRTHAPKNITLVPEDHWELLKEEYPQIYDHLKKTKDEFSILTEVPSNYYDSAYQLAQKNAKIGEVTRSLAEKDGVISAKDAEIEALKARLLAFGDKNV